MGNATKQALATALRDLLNTTTLDNITVKDIVDRADVSRQTFYYHFGDIYQLLDWAFQSSLKKLYERSEENWRDRILFAVEYLRTNRALTMNVYHSLGAEYLGAALEKAIRPVVAGAFGHIDLPLQINEEDREFAISFFTYGVMGTILQWLDAGMSESLDRIVNDIYHLFNPREKLLDDGNAGEE